MHFYESAFVDVSFCSAHPTCRDGSNAPSSLVEEMDKHDDHTLLLKEKAFPEDDVDNLRVSFSKIMSGRYGFKYGVTEENSDKSWTTPCAKWSDVLGEINKLA